MMQFVFCRYTYKKYENPPQKCIFLILMFFLYFAIFGPYFQSFFQINIINEKIYVFLWFWLVLLSILTILSVIYHMFVLVTPSMTRMVLRNRSMNQSDLPFEEMGKRFELGDWKLLSILSRNMEPLVFGEFIRELYEAMKNLERYDANYNASRQSLIKSKA